MCERKTMKSHPSGLELLPCSGIVLPIDKISTSFLLQDGLDPVIFWLIGHATAFLLLSTCCGLISRCM